jgi:hypothetical protein
MSGGLLTNMLLRETGTQVILGSAIGFGGTMRPPTIAILPIFGRFRLRTPGLFDRRSDPWATTTSDRLETARASA